MLNDQNFSNTLNVKLTHEHAKVPIRGTPDSAGYDLYALMSGVVPPRGKSIVRTGICIQMPVLPMPYLSLYGSIRSRSGLSAKHDIEVGAGVIDSGYTDEIKVILRNNSDTEFRYEQGDRIAQLVLEVYWKTDQVKVVDYIPPTNRTGGFGSTGLK
jgi:dUTP pyrophosphatase